MRMLAIVLTLLLVSFALAQDVPPPQPVPEPEAKITPTPEPEAVDPAVEEARRMRWERTVYVPFRELKKVFENEGEGVYVPRKEFLELWRKAMDRDQQKGTPTTPFLITKALYTGRVDGSLAVVSATIEVETFHEGWIEVPLGLSGVALGEATLDGGPATMTLVKGAHRLLVPKPGKHRLTLDFVTAIREGKDGRSLSFGCPPCPVARLDFTVPGRGVKVTVDPNLATTRSDEGGKTTQVLAYVGGAGKVSLRWKPRPTDLVAGPPLLLAQTRLTATYGEGVLRTDVRVDYRILRAPVGTFSVKIPADVRVLFVEGIDLRDWKVEGEGDDRRLVASLHTPARDAYRLTMTLETPAEDLSKPIPVPEIVEEGVLRAQGLVVVRGPQDTQIRSLQTKGVFRMNIARLPKDLASASNVLAYRFPAHPWSLPLQVERIQPRVTIVERTAVNLGERKRELRALFDITVARAGIFQLTLAAPRDLTILDVGPEALVEDWRVVMVDSDDGAVTNRIVVDLKGRREGVFTLTVTGEAEFAIADQEVEATLPLVTPLDVERLSGTIGVIADESFDLKTVKVEGLDPLDPRQAVARLGGGRNLRLAMAFRYQGQGRSGTLSVRRKRSEVAARSLTRIKVEENRALLKTDLDFEVRYAGVDTFRFSLPVGIPEDDVVVTAGGLKEKSTRIVSEGARREWTVTTQSKVRGMLRIRIETHLAFEALEAGARTTVSVPDLHVPDVVREVHWYAVTKDPVLEIESEQTRIEVVDPRELPAEARKDGAFLAFRALEPAYRLTLQVRRHEYVPLLDTVIDHMEVVTKLSREGVALHTATLALRFTGRQYLPVRMPDGANIQEVAIREGGRTTKVRPRIDEATSRTLIPLGASTAGERTIRIRLVYRQDEVAMDGVFTTSFLLVAPRFGEDEAEVPVSGTSWTVWLPKDIIVTATDGNMNAVKLHHSWVHRAIRRYLPAMGAKRGVAARIDPIRSQKKELRRIDFSRAEGDAEIGASFGSPTLFTILQILFLLGAVAVGIGVGRRRPACKAPVCVSLVVVPLVFLAFVGPGWGMIFNAIFAGGLIAGAAWIAIGTGCVATTWWHSRPQPLPVVTQIGTEEVIEADDAPIVDDESDGTDAKADGKDS
jgi:hypothetical protein